MIQPSYGSCAFCEFNTGFEVCGASGTGYESMYCLECQLADQPCTDEHPEVCGVDGVVYEKSVS